MTAEAKEKGKGGGEGTAMTSAAALTTSVAHSVTDVDAAAWDALVDENDPFLEHAFLAALEQSGSVGRRAGWRPHFVLVHEGPALVGAVPLYLKDNSYGEFIFDWGWANASLRARIPYYPKLVAAVPFTPVTGSRLLVHPRASVEPVRAALVQGMRALAEDTAASSVHVLFCLEDEAAALVRLGAASGFGGGAAAGESKTSGGFRHRLSMQFHWVNREPPYQDFDDFLGAFRSRHRKQVRKERVAAAAHGLRFATLRGPELGQREWNALHAFYEANADKHGSPTYLTGPFFRLLRERAPLTERVVATLAYQGEVPVAGTLNFERGAHLYGRYWGCLQEHERLHFELCYYQLIDRAIGRGYRRFEAGAQGEHKLKRGLAPAFTHSAHWLRHPELARGVAGYIEAEAQSVREAVAQYTEMSPYKKAGEEE